jgi:hypothetical protein
VHVGDLVGAAGVTVRNLALGSLTDNLLGSISVVPAGFTAATARWARRAWPRARSAAALSIGLDTGEAGVFNGNATLVFVSHNDEMADLALANQQRRAAVRRSTTSPTRRSPKPAGTVHWQRIAPATSSTTSAV